MHQKKFCDKYATLLSPEDRRDYFLKTAICSLDPYELSRADVVRLEDVDFVIDVSREDLISHLVIIKNKYTMEEMKVFKGLEAHNFLTSAHVGELLCKTVHDNEVVVMSQVKHSQSAGFVCAWVLVKMSGEILTAHCTCVAGLTGVCSHVCAVMFSLELINLRKSSVSCTSRDNAWLPPTLSTVPLCEVRDCDFTSAPRKWDELCGKAQSKKLKPSEAEFLAQCIPSDEEVVELLKEVEESDPSCAVLRVVRDFHEKYIPKVPEDDARLPKPFQFTDHSFSDLDFEQLLVVCESLFASLEITEDESNTLEEATRAQYKCVLWMQHRSGRIRASLMKEACVTDVNSPSITLVKKICYPSQFSFRTGDTDRGIVDEPLILDAYRKDMEASHDDFLLKECGFYVPPKYPFLGGSPDSIAACLCHGVRGVEVKSIVSNQKENTGLFGDKLSRDHKFMYQIQTQMIAAGLPCVDFVVKLPALCPVKSHKKFPGFRLHLENILPIPDMQQEIIGKATTLFKKVILPELVCKYFSLQKNLLRDRTNTNGNSDFSAPICLCQRPPKPPMINCSGKNCSIVTFHRVCIGLSNRRKKFLCDSCEKANRVAKTRKPKTNFHNLAFSPQRI